MNRRSKFLIIASIFLLSGPSPASADLVGITINSTGAGESNLNATFNGEATTLTFAGSLNTTATQSNQLTSTFNSYCIDLYHYFAIPASWMATPSATFSGNSGVPNSDPTGSNGPTIAYLYNVDGGGGSGTPTNVQAAAVQIAIWTVEYDGFAASGFAKLPDAPGNAFYFASDNNGDVQSQVYNQAKIDLTGLTASNTSTATFYQAVHSGNLYQDIIGPFSNTILPTVPEPSSLVLMAAGLGMVAFRVRRARLDRSRGPLSA